MRSDIASREVNSRRQNGVCDAVAGLFRLWNRRGDMDLECSVEVNLSSLGYRRKTPDEGERRADFCLENVMTGTHIFTDVRIVHQDMTASATVKDPYADLETVYKQKMAHYKEAFELDLVKKRYAPETGPVGAATTVADIVEADGLECLISSQDSSSTCLQTD